MYSLDKEKLLRNDIHILSTRNTDIFIGDNWESGIICGSESIYFHVTEFCFYLPEDKNRYNEIRSMFDSREIDIKLCDYVWSLYLYVKTKHDHIKNMVYDYIPPLKYVDKFKNYSVVFSDNIIRTFVTKFVITDDFTLLLKNGLPVSKGLESIYEQMSETLDFAPIIKSAK